MEPGVQRSGTPGKSAKNSKTPKGVAEIRRTRLWRFLYGQIAFV